MKSKFLLLICLFVLGGLNFFFISSSSEAAIFLIDPIGPSDPTVGNWDSSTKTLTLTRDVNDSLFIQSPGITLDGMDPVTSVKHKIFGPAPTAFGVLLPFVGNITVKNCEISGFTFGVLGIGGSDYHFDSNHIHNNSSLGILIISGTGHVVSDNSFSDNGSAINLNNSTFSKVLNNTSVVGSMSINNSADIELVGNHVREGYSGIALNWSTRVYMRNNTIENTLQANFKIDGPQGASRDPVNNAFDHDIDTSNTVNGKKIYYFKGQSGLFVNPATYPDAATFIFYDCDGITVENYFFDSSIGSAVQLVRTNNSTVRNIQSLNNKFGVDLFSSDGNLIELNAIRMRDDVPFDYLIRGMEIKESHNNIIRNNLIYGEGWRGILTANNGSNNTIRDNFIFGADEALTLTSENSIIEYNVIVDGGGIIINDGAHGSIIRNNVVANGTEVLFFERRDPPTERGIWCRFLDNVQVYHNLVMNMLGDGVYLEGAQNTEFYNNDFINNALPGTNPNGDSVFQAFSEVTPYELSVPGLGNYWGREEAPYFVPGTDSNAADVTDSNASGTPNVLIPIDIKPGDGKNSINLNSRGVITVAVLSTPDFDARTLNPETGFFHGLYVKSNKNGNMQVHEEDVNGDGLTDVVCQFDNDGSLLLDEKSTYAFFTAKTYDGKIKYGQDSIKVVP